MEKILEEINSIYEKSCESHDKSMLEVFKMEFQIYINNWLLEFTNVDKRIKLENAEEIFKDFLEERATRELDRAVECEDY